MNGRPEQPRGRLAGIASAPSFQNEKLSRNETRMDGPAALRLAKALRNATQYSATLFGHDVRTAAQLLARVLQHESGQQGFELAATQDADFHQVGGRGRSLGGRTRRSRGGGGGAVVSPGRLPVCPGAHSPRPPQGFSLAPPLPWR